MTRRLLVLLVMVGLAVAGTVLHADEDVLAPGTYTAKVKALTCAGCGPLVKKTLEGMKAIESASVDQKAHTVEFTVRKDASVKLTDVQQALKAAADKMGMGADYTLSNVKRKTA